MKVTEYTEFLQNSAGKYNLASGWARSELRSMTRIGSMPSGQWPIIMVMCLVSAALYSRT